MKLFLLLLFFCFLISPVIGQELQTETKVPPLVTDRPDQTESAEIVPQGFLQLETGPYLIVDGGEKQEWSYNTLMFRYGVLAWLELRLVGSYDGFRYASPEGDATEKGFGPLILGTKVKLFEERGVIPQTALMYHISLTNTGSESFELVESEHELRANFSNTLTEKLGIAYNIGARWLQFEDAEALYTLSMAYSLSDRLGVFGEVYGFLSEETQNKHAVDAGFTYLVQPNIQLDAYVGRGLSETASDWLFGAGFSWRIPR